MTLSSFKFKAKGSLLVIFLAIYGISLFTLGRFTGPKIGEEIKGVSTNSVERNIIENPQPYADEQKAEVISNSVKNCSNATFGFEISYQKDWYTTQNNDPQKCTFFAPFSFVVPQLVDSDIVPIKVEVVIAQEWQSTILLYSEPNQFQNIDTVQNVELNGKPVTIVGSISTGLGQIPKGYYKQSYLITDSRSPLIISYTQMTQVDKIENNKQILKEMAESIKLF